MENFNNSNFGCESLSSNDYIQITGGEDGLFDGLADLVKEVYTIGKELGAAIVKAFK